MYLTFNLREIVPTILKLALMNLYQETPGFSGKYVALAVEDRRESIYSFCNVDNHVEAMELAVKTHTTGGHRTGASVAYTVFGLCNAPDFCPCGGRRLHTIHMSSIG